MAVVSLPVTLVDGAGFSWDISLNGTVPNGTNDAFDGAALLNNFNGSFAALSELGGRQIVIGPEVEGAVTVTRKIFVSETLGFARYLEVVTNTGSASAQYLVDLSTSLGSDSSTTSTTSSGDAAFTATDRWIVTDDGPLNDPAVAHVVSGAGGAGPSAAVLNGDQVNYDYALTLAPGETKIVMHFIAQAETSAAATAMAKTLAGLPDAALTGLTDAERQQIVNFDADDGIVTDYVGTKADDVLVGSDLGETFKGRQGDDVISADAGRDSVAGESGDDVLLGGSGADTIIGGAGADTVEGGDDADLIFSDADNGLETSSAVATIRSTGEKIAVSLTLPDAATGTTLDVSGFVSRTPVTSETLNIAFVIDVSGSTADVFQGDVDVGDVNGDGVANTVLDAEIAGFEALLAGITEQIGDENVNVSVIPFQSSANTTFSGSARVDSDGDGTPDVVEALRAFRSNGGTNFESGLQQAVTALGGNEDGQNLLFFLSDGENNEGGEFTDEVATLLARQGIRATIKSYGVGSDASEPQLDLVDDQRDNGSVQIVLDPSALAETLIDPGIDTSDIDRVEILVNGKVAKTIDGDDLVETPLGLRFEFNETVRGLKVGADDVVSARVIASDPAKTKVSTQQTVEETGAEGDDVLLGGSGDDTIRAGGEDDRVYGGAGSDILSGDAGSDQIYGGGGDDRIDGGDGADTLAGGRGADRLTGGGGKDVFLFGTEPATNAAADVITDFSVRDDTIHLDRDVFTALGKAGKLAKASFVTGEEAADAKDRIVYDATSGKLLYDADGSGARAAVLIATLDDGLKLTAADFLVV